MSFFAGQQYGGAQLKIQYSNQNARAITTNQNAYAPPLGGIPALGTAVGAYNAEAALAAALAMTHAPPPGPVGLVPQMMNSMMVQVSFESQKVIRKKIQDTHLFEFIIFSKIFLTFF